MIVRTEHNGPKRGKGFYGRKAQAKKLSNKRRRINDRRSTLED